MAKRPLDRRRRRFVGKATDGGERCCETGDVVWAEAWHTEHTSVATSLMHLRHPRAVLFQHEAASVIAGGGAGQVRHSLLIGVVSGLAAVTCCVSPVVLVLLGVATAAQEVTLEDTLYCDYGRWFRGGGIVVAPVAVFM